MFIRLMTIAVLAVGLMPSPAGARSKEVNAATWYRRAQERLAHVPSERLQALFAFGMPGEAATLSSEDRQLLAELQPVIALARQASKQEYSDFEIDYAQGLELTLPHANQLRTLAKLMRADAAVRLSEGDSAGAAANFAAMYGMADHLRDDRIIIASLVGQAIFSLADASAQQAIDRGQIGPEDAAAMLRALQRMPTDDPFDYVEAVANEQEFMLGWIESKLDEDHGAEWFAQAMGLAADDPRAVAIAEMTPEDFDEELRVADAVVDRVISVFLVDDPEQARAQWAAIEKEISQGESGLMGTLGLMPAYGKVLERKFAAVAALQSRTKLLRALVSGETTPEQEANAAVWYLRGVEMLRRLEEPALVRIRAAAAEPAAPMDGELSKVLGEAGGIIAVFREASLKKRCDFAPLRPPGDVLLRDYVGGLREAAHLLHADAIRAQHADDTDGLVERLSICLRMSAHLAGDDALLSSLTSHRIFLASARLVPARAGESTLSTDQGKELLKAVDATSRKDPFEYISALRSDRALVKRWVSELRVSLEKEAQAARVAAAPVQQQRQGTPPPSTQPDAAPASPDPGAIIDGWDGDRVLFMAVALETLRPRPPGEESGVASRMAAELGDVVAAEALLGARGHAPALRADLAAGRFDALAQPQAALIASTAQRMREARADVRRVISLLQPQASMPDQSPVMPSPAPAPEEAPGGPK